MFSLALEWLFDKFQNKQSLKMTTFACMWGKSAPSCGEKPTYMKRKKSSVSSLYPGAHMITPLDKLPT
jgi:hypothetical protein